MKHLRSKKMVVFDFDDTLFETFKTRSIALIDAAKYFGVNVSVDDVKKVWGTPFPKMISLLLPEVQSEEFEIYYRKVMTKYPPKPTKGAKELLEHLYKRGVLTVIISSSKSLLISQDLQQAGLEKYIDKIFGIDITKYRKPDTRSFLPVRAFCDSKNIRLFETIYIGDSIVDFVLANKLGIDFYAITTGFDPKTEFLNLGLCKEKIYNSLEEFLNTVY